MQRRVQAQVLVGAPANSVFACFAPPYLGRWWRGLDGPPAAGAVGSGLRLTLRRAWPLPPRPVVVTCYRPVTTFAWRVEGACPWEVTVTLFPRGRATLVRASLTYVPSGPGLWAGLRARRRLLGALGRLKALAEARAGPRR